MSDRQTQLNEELRRIFANGKIQQIKWGADNDTQGWSVWDDKTRLRYAMDLASAMNQAAEILQKERNELLDAVTLAKKQLENADQRVAIQKETLTEAITKHNADRQSDANLIVELRARVEAQDKVIEQLNEQLGK